ncbi:MAG: hypothetical protein U9N35_06760 [Euryarchaeota archaeon]|nr:hypothetical protein [Euryarchaeota archaeon]
MKDEENKKKEIEKDDFEEEKGFWSLKRVVGIALIVLVLLFTLIGIGVWRGLKDIADDEKILMVVEKGDVAKAASIYDTDTGEGEAVNVEVLPALNNLKRFYDAVVDVYGTVDRMLIANTEAVYKLSLDPSIEFRGTDVDRDTLVEWVVGESYPPKELQQDQKAWDFRADLLNEWFDYYYDKLDQGQYRGPIVENVMDLYRDGNLTIYKSNLALTVLKYISIEQIII